MSSIRIQPAEVSTLRRVVDLSNELAKSLEGPARNLAYRIKAEACSALIVCGVARANGTRGNGIVGLDIEDETPCRVHICRAHLNEAARRILDTQAGLLPAVSPIGERLQHRTTPECGLGDMTRRIA